MASMNSTPGGSPAGQDGSVPAPRKKTTLLLILDGWGHRDGNSPDNAISRAATPTWDRLWANAPHTLLSTSGMAVGLPEGQMGNSEVGHMNLGAGRVVYQNLTKIDKAIEDGSFYETPALTQAVEKAISAGGAVHIAGLLSPGGIHSHEAQILAMVDLAHRRGAKKIYIHAFLDGRDTAPRSAADSLQVADEKLRSLGCGHIASLIGRYYAMDRDNRWERVQQAYELMTEGRADHVYTSPGEALEAAYERDENDEFVRATSIRPEGEAITVDDNDALIFMNFRADRARQLTHAFITNDFEGFERGRRPALADFVMLTEYAADLVTSCAFPPDAMSNVFGEYLANQGRTQLRIAETEKYAHVTFFFSGGREEPFDGEERILVPSPQVATYDLKPEMSAPEVTDRLTDAIRSGKYDTIVCNYANGDMVGHTGDFDAAVKAVEAVDQCLGRITEAIRESGGQCLITADHGNAEQMRDEVSGQPLTSHTSGPVPLVYVGGKTVEFSGEGSLSDVAPTLLFLMDMPAPEEMTGHSVMRAKVSSSA